MWVPWALWQAYGERQMLSDQYDSMAAHVRRVESLLSPTGLWDTGFQFGDWLDPTAPPDQPADAKADKGVVATACLYRDARIVAETAELLGRTRDAEHFAALAERTRAAFTSITFNDDGTIHSDAQTVVHPGDRLRPARRADRRAGGKPASGTGGRERIPHPDRLRRHAVPADALSGTGHLDEAYRLLLQRECPRGCTRSPWAPRRSGSAGTRCCPTAPSTQAR